MKDKSERFRISWKELTMILKFGILVAKYHSDVSKEKEHKDLKDFGFLTKCIWGESGPSK